MFRGWFRSVLILIVATCAHGHAQELEPRRWTHLPVDTNFVSLGVVDTAADVSFDPALQITGAELSATTVGAGYIRTFELLGKSARVDLLQAWMDAEWSGELAGLPTTVARQGWTDTVVRFATQLYGAPPLEGAAYREYRAAHPVETLVGAGLAVELPTGEYMSDRLLNLGSNRFTFVPQLGLVHNRGPLSLEFTALARLATDNTDFFNGGTLEQEPVYNLQGHAIYTLDGGLWVAAGAAVGGGGRTTVNGVANDDPRDAWYYGASAGYPLAPWLGVKISYIAARRDAPAGPNSDSLVLGLSTFW